MGILPMLSTHGAARKFIQMPVHHHDPSGARRDWLFLCMNRDKRFSSPSLLAKLTARDVMTAEPRTVTLATKLSKVSELMEEGHIQHFPVVDGQRLVGMLSERHLRDAMPSVLTVDDPEARRRYLRVTEVAQVMPKHSPTVAPDAPLAEVIRIMRAHRVGEIAVAEGESLFGIVTSGDLITLLERILRSAESWPTVG
jgi:CBS domain-containing protein